MSLPIHPAGPPRVLAVDLPACPPGGRATIQGWLHRRRDAELPDVAEEAVLRVTGTVTHNPVAPGGVELTAPSVEVLAEPVAPPAVEVWRPTLKAALPVLLDNASLAWRHPRQRALWQLSAAALHGFRAALDALAFTEVQTPKIVGNVTESGANVFRLDYFGQPAFLAQSPQFYKQQLVGVFERVYETGPVFRAEPSDTVRHLAEYVSLDAELGFIENHRDVLSVLREAVAGMLDAVAGSEAADLLGLEVPTIPESVPVIHFAEALRIVGAPEHEPDLAPAHERALGEWARREHGSEFLAVEGYPMSKRPFYTHPQPDDPRWSNSFDLLFGGLELVTGGQRLHRHADYVAALTARGEDPADYRDYLSAFANGMPPHGGFAIGLERFAARLSGAENIRQVTLFPRDLHRVRP